MRISEWRLLQDGHKLKDYEGPADLQVLKSHFQRYQFSWRPIVVSSESCSLYYIFPLQLFEDQIKFRLFEFSATCNRRSWNIAATRLQFPQNLSRWLWVSALASLKLACASSISSITLALSFAVLTFSFIIFKPPFMLLTLVRYF